MHKLATFKDYNTSAPVHIDANRLIGFRQEYAKNAKPEDKPIGIRVFVDGIPEGILVNHTYGEVVNTFRTEAELEI